MKFIKTQEKKVKQSAIGERSGRTAGGKVVKPVKNQVLLATAKTKLGKAVEAKGSNKYLISSLKTTKQSSNANAPVPKKKAEFPDKVPFWARLKIEKRRPTLVIDEETVLDKKSKKQVDGFVHREVTHNGVKNDEIFLKNPKVTDTKPMYIKAKVSKHPKKLLKPFNPDWVIPDELIRRYEKNNRDK